MNNLDMIRLAAIDFYGLDYATGDRTFDGSTMLSFGPLIGATLSSPTRSIPSWRVYYYTPLGDASHSFDSLASALDWICAAIRFDRRQLEIS